jgi:hypothetical protein
MVKVLVTKVGREAMSIARARGEETFDVFLRCGFESRHVHLFVPC